MGLANSELERKMATAVTLLRRGVAEARANHRLLKAEATALEQFVPVMVEGARRGIYEALQQQDALLAETRAAHQREAAERRRLHNVVQVPGDGGGGSGGGDGNKSYITWKRRRKE